MNCCSLRRNLLSGIKHSESVNFINLDSSINKESFLFVVDDFSLLFLFFSHAKVISLVIVVASGKFSKQNLSNE